MDLPAIGKEDHIRLMVFDDLGNKLGKNHANVLTSNLDNGTIHKQVRELFPSEINKDASYLSVQAEVVQNEANTVQQMD